MKKRFFQTSATFLLSMVFMTALLAFCVYYVVLNIIDAYWTGFAFTLIGAVVSLGTIISASYSHIVVDEEKICASGALIAPIDRVQYRTEVRFDEIRDIEIIYGPFDSNGEYLLRQYKTYIKFYTIDGEKRICISGNNHVQRENILELIVQKTGINKNYEYLLEEFRTTGGTEVFQERKFHILDYLVTENSKARTLGEIEGSFPVLRTVFPKFDVSKVLEVMKREELVTTVNKQMEIYYVLTEKGQKEQKGINYSEEKNN